MFFNAPGTSCAAGVQLAQQRVVQRLRAEFRHAAAGSLMSPNTMASAGQACWHAVTISPSATGRSSFSLAILARVMRCTQYVHFSMTPRLRTVTSGLRPSFKLGVSQSW